MILVIKELLAVLSAFFSLKREKLVYEMLEESEDKQLELIRGIEQNRDKKTEESALEADFLATRLEKEKEKYAKILNRL